MKNLKKQFSILFVITISFTSIHQLSGQTIDVAVINPQGGAGSDYKYFRIGDGTSYWGGIMWNNTSAAYGNGNDLSIYTYDNRDITFRTGTGNIVFFPSSGGLVGIGTQTPQNKLELRGGDFYTDGNIKWGNASLSYDYPYNQIKWGDNTNWYLSFNRKSDNEKLFTMRSSDGMTYFKGSVGIGTNTPDYKLDVIGTIRAREIKVDLKGADFVFEDDYNLRTLEDVESFVKERKHLPGIESAKDMESDGAELGGLNSKLLQKIEELTLYMIDMNKRMNSLETENSELKKEVIELKSIE